MRRPSPAEPAPAALIVGTANYAALPPIAGCARSANAVSAALRALGFQVTERQDASTGGIDAGISEFSQHLADGKRAGFVYICGYATDFNDRTFLLPTTARIGRPSDVLTQGVLAKSMLATVSTRSGNGGGGGVRSGTETGCAAADRPRCADAISRCRTEWELSRPVKQRRPTVPRPSPRPWSPRLTGPEVRTEDLLAGVKTRLAGSKLTVAAVHMPAHPGILAGPPQAAPVAVAPAATTGPTGGRSRRAGCRRVRDRDAPAMLPDEAQMTDPDRRKVQIALVRLGYYDHAGGWLFGPETRAAIRRYQHEIGS